MPEPSVHLLTNFPRQHNSLFYILSAVGSTEKEFSLPTSSIERLRKHPTTTNISVSEEVNISRELFLGDMKSDKTRDQSA